MIVGTSEMTGRAASVITWAVTTVVVATAVVLLRFITRAQILKFVGKEDWCSVMALVNSHGKALTFMEI
jgi:hypothetical protein